MTSYNQIEVNGRKYPNRKTLYHWKVKYLDKKKLFNAGMAVEECKKERDGPRSQHNEPAFMSQLSAQISMIEVIVQVNPNLSLEQLLKFDSLEASVKIKWLNELVQTSEEASKKDQPPGN